MSPTKYSITVFINSSADLRSEGSKGGQVLFTEKMVVGSQYTALLQSDGHPSSVLSTLTTRQSTASQSLTQLLEA